MSLQEPSLPGYVKRFFSHYLPGQRNCSPHTISSYRNAIRLFLIHLRQRKNIAPSAVTVQDLSPENILDYLNALQESRKNSTTTRNIRLAAIRSFAKYLMMMEPTWSSDLQPVLAIPVKRTQRRTLDFLTHEEMDAILAAPDTGTWSGKRDHILFTVMYATGARVSEMVTATVSDARLNPGGTLRLHGKGRKERILPLWKSTAKSLARWIAENHLSGQAPLFPNGRGGHLTRSGVEKRLQDAVGKASERCPSLKTKRVSPHTLRHTTAMHLLEANVDLATIALWLGHESIETTHVYMTSNMAMKEKALSVLQEPSVQEFRFQPKDDLLAFLEAL